MSRFSDEGYALQELYFMQAYSAQGVREYKLIAKYPRAGRDLVDDLNDSLPF